MKVWVVLLNLQIRWISLKLFIPKNQKNLPRHSQFKLIVGRRAAPHRTKVAFVTPVFCSIFTFSYAEKPGAREHLWEIFIFISIEKLIYWIIRKHGPPSKQRRSKKSVWGLARTKGPYRYILVNIVSLLGWVGFGFGKSVENRRAGNRLFTAWRDARLKGFVWLDGAADERFIEVEWTSVYSLDHLSCGSSWSRLMSLTIFLFVA